MILLMLVRRGRGEGGESGSKPMRNDDARVVRDEWQQLRRQDEVDEVKLARGDEGYAKGDGWLVVAAGNYWSDQSVITA